MPRAGFGGGSDYSGMFASLFLQDEQNRERLARDLEQRNDERQAAKDEEMFSKFSHGEISGADILGYIRKRVEQTAYDPEQHAKWKDALRDYEQSIADQNAEDAFANGGSIHQLIGYYRDRLKAVERGTPIYSQMMQRLNQLVDQSAGEDLYLGEQRILDKIGEGKATYADLIKFYQGQLKNLRPGSTVRDDVVQRLDQTQDAQKQQQVESRLAEIDYKFRAGQMNANQANREIQAIASQFQNSDPTRYWQLLEQGHSYIEQEQQRLLQEAAQNGQDDIPNPGALSNWGVPTDVNDRNNPSLPGSNTPRPSTPGNNNPSSSSPGRSAEALISAAEKYLGTRYKLGREDSNAMDCSGLIFRAFMDSNLGSMINDRRMLARGYQRYFSNMGQFSNDMSDLRRGDLVMYDNGKHIGIYLGNGKVMSALTTTGITVHRINGISTPVTGYLIIDWSQSPRRDAGQGGGAADPTDVLSTPRRPRVPTQPAAESDEHPQTPTAALPEQNTDERQRDRSRTDPDGNPRPYNLDVPTTESDVREQIQSIAALQDRALTMHDALVSGQPFFTEADGTRTPLTEDGVRAAMNEAFDANDYRMALSYAINDFSGAQAANNGRSNLATQMLQMGDVRQEELWNNLVRDVDKAFAYTDTFILDPNRAHQVAQDAINNLTGFAAKLDPGDPLADEAVSSVFAANVQTVIAALNTAIDPKATQVDIDAATASIPEAYRGIVNGVGNVTQTVTGINDGSMVITVQPGADGKPTFVAAPARADTLTNGETVLIPNIPGVTRAQMAPVVVNVGGQPQVIWVQPTLEPSQGQPLNQLVISSVDPALQHVFPQLFPVDPKTGRMSAPDPGMVITSDILATASRADVERLIAAGVLNEAPMLWRTIVVPPHDPDGPTTRINIGDERPRWQAVGTQGIQPESRWYQDPETLQWFQGRLPIATAQPDGFGGVLTDPTTETDPGGAHLVWRPDSGLIGVPVPTATDDRTTQQMLNDGLLNGILPPTIYRDQNGNITTDPNYGLLPDPAHVYDRTPLTAAQYLGSRAFRDFRAGERAPAPALPAPPPLTASGSAFIAPHLSPGAPIWGSSLFPSSSDPRAMLDQFLASRAGQDFRAGERALPAPPPAAPRPTTTATTTAPAAPRINVARFVPPPASQTTTTPRINQATGFTMPQVPAMRDTPTPATPSVWRPPDWQQTRLDDAAAGRSPNEV